MELAPNSILKERYEIIRKLGQGGMGAVYLARDLTLEHVVAIKINRNISESSTSQFLREAKLLATLRHSNLPRVTDYFLMEGAQYLVMDYIPGDDLDTLMKSRSQFPLDMVMKWADQLGSALSYLHSQQPPVIHRDIKPANIKITPSDEVMLVDFGIAKEASADQATATGASGYTPGFAPPEQYGSSRTGPFSDQYSFAATLYTLLTGQRPVDSVMRVMNTGVLAPMNLLNPAVPQPVQAAIEKAMSIRPDERFASVDEFLRALHAPSVEPTVAQPTYPPAPRSNFDLDAPTRASVPVQPVAVPVVQPQRKGVPAWVWGILAGVGLVAVAGVIVLLLVLNGNRPASPSSATDLPAVSSPVAGKTPEPSKAAVTKQPAAADAPTATPTVTATPEPSPTSAPALLGNGGAIAYVSNRADGSTFQIWLMHVALNDSGQVVVVDNTQLTFDAGDKTDPAWSPDGTRLLYAAPSGSATNGLDIFLLDLAAPDTAPVNLTNHRGDDTQPAWSPDGSLIAFNNVNPQREDYAPQLYLMKPDGAEMQRISYDFIEYSPDWTPDMKYLVFVINAANTQLLYLRDQQTAYKTPDAFDQGEVLGRQGVASHPAVSPDGSLLAYTENNGTKTNLFVTRFVGRGATKSQLTTTDSDDNAAWSPDLQWILFDSGRDGNREIYIMNTAGAGQTNLTNDPAIDMLPAWQPQP